MKTINNNSEIDAMSSSYRKFNQSSRFNQFTFVLLGAGMLMPWNAMLAAMDFFDDQFPNYKPSFSLLVAVSAPMFLVQATVFFLLQNIPL